MQSNPYARSYVLFGVGSVGNGVFAAVPGLLLMFYMTQVLAIPAGLAAIGVFIPKLVDLVTDPIVGVLSDRTHTRWGARRPYMFVGALLIGPAFWLLFSIGTLNVTGSVVIVALVFSLNTVIYTLFMVPYISLAGEIPTSYNDRTRMNLFRMSFVMVGSLASGALAPLLVDWAGGGATGYAFMGGVFAAVLTASLLVALYSVRREPPRAPPPDFSWRAVSTVVRGNPAFAVLIASYVLNVVAVGSVSTALPYFNQYVLGRDGSGLSSIFVSLYVGSLATIPMWRMLADRYGKYHTLLASLVVSSMGVLLLLLLDAQTPEVYVLGLAMLVGITTSAKQMLTFSMLADTIAYGGREVPSADHAATFTGLFIAAEKTGFAFGPLLFGGVLAYVGFVEGGQEVQSPRAVEGIRFALSYLPMVLFVAGIAVFMRYRKYDAAFRAANAT